MQQDETTKIKAYSKAQLCDLYNISPTLLKTWLDNAKIKTNHKKVLTPNQVKQLFDQIGKPEE